MKYHLIFLFALILVMGFASAEIGKLPQPVKQGDCVNLPQNELNSTYQNITYIQAPGNVTLDIYSNMTKRDSSYKYYFCNTSIVGTYLVNGFSDLSEWSYYFEVNQKGLTDTGSSATAMTVAIFSMFLVSVLFFAGFIFFQHPSARICFAVMSSIFLIAGINLVFNSLNNAGIDPNVISLFDFIGAASYYFYWLGAGILAITLFLTTLTSIFDRAMKKKQEKYQ